MQVFNIEFKNPGETPETCGGFPQDWQVIVKCDVNGKTLDYCRVTLDHWLDSETFEYVYMSPRCAIAAAREACKTAQEYNPQARIIGAEIQVF